MCKSQGPYTGGGGCGPLTKGGWLEGHDHHVLEELEARSTHGDWRLCIFKIGLMG